MQNVKNGSAQEIGHTRNHTLLSLSLALIQSIYIFSIYFYFLFLLYTNRREREGRVLLIMKHMQAVPKVVFLSFFFYIDIYSILHSNREYNYDIAVT